MGYTLGAPKVTWRYVAVETISREELKEKMDRGDDFVLVDTMAEMYYRHSHLPGAINVPVDELGERAPELLPDKHAEIIVYCIDLRARPRRRPPASSRPWATGTCVNTSGASRTG